MGMGIDARWIDVDGIRTRYYDAGRGAPILFVTGGHFGNPVATSVVETWDRNFLPLTAAGRVIAVEKLGQGHTDNPRSDAYTMQAVVAHLAAFLDALDLQGVHVVGQSAGALPAAALVRERPGRVRSCTLINSSTLSPGVGMTDVNLSGCPHPPYTRDGQRWVMERSAFDPGSVTDDYVEAGFRVLCLEKYQDSVQAMQGGLKEALFLPRLAVLKDDLLHWMRRGGLARPTQVVWGANDRTAPLERGVALYQRRTSATVRSWY
jgi:2-hydroxy-6-oxonona-2,4-dienedioate hydrolase